MTLFADAQILHEGKFRKGSLRVRDGKIAELIWNETQPHDGEIIPAENCWLIPGMIDAHAHGYATILRGTENNLPLELWALYTTLYGQALDARAMRVSILLGAAERLRCGITGTVDHTPQVHLAEAALAAHEQSGLRVGYAPFLQDISDYVLMGLELPQTLGAWARGPKPLDDAFEGRFAEIVTAARTGSGRVRPLLGPNAPQRCSPDAWAMWRRLRDRHDVPVHTHLLETRAQALVGQRKWRGGTVAEMHRQGLLDSRLSVAHGVWPTLCERKLLARERVTVVHNPASNMMLGSGILPYASYRELGVAMALGSDSANTGGRHDLFEIMRLASMLHRAPGSDPSCWPQGADLLDMATHNGAHVLGLGCETGRIAVGRAADLVLVRRATASTTLMEETSDSFVLHASEGAIAGVMIAGNWALREGTIQAFDETAVIAEARDVHAEIRQRLHTSPQTVRDSLPGLANGLARFLEETD